MENIDVLPPWIFEEYIGDDDEGNPVFYDPDCTYWWMGDDEEGNAIIVEIP